MEEIGIYLVDNSIHRDTYFFVDGILFLIIVWVFVKKALKKLRG